MAVQISKTMGFDDANKTTMLSGGHPHLNTADGPGDSRVAADEMAGAAHIHGPAQTCHRQAGVDGLMIKTPGKNRSECRCT